MILRALKKDQRNKSPDRSGLPVAHNKSRTSASAFHQLVARGIFKVYVRPKGEIHGSASLALRLRVLIDAARGRRLVHIDRLL